MAATKIKATGLNRRNTVLSLCCCLLGSTIALLVMH